MGNNCPRRRNLTRVLRGEIPLWLQRGQPLLLFLALLPFPGAFTGVEGKTATSLDLFVLLAFFGRRSRCRRMLLRDGAAAARPLPLLIGDGASAAIASLRDRAGGHCCVLSGTEPRPLLRPLGD